MKYVILTDIHANHIALHAVLQSVKAQYGEADVRFIFLGDLLGYGPMEGALECVNWWMGQKDLVWIAGNHDEWIVNSMDKISNDAQVSLLSHRLYLEEKGALDLYLESMQQFMGQSHESQILVKKIGDTTLLFTHGDFSEEGKRLTYIMPWKRSLISVTLKTARKQHPNGKILLFCGHTHFPLMVSMSGPDLHYHSIYYGKPVKVKSCTLFNPGSVGQPRDGDPRAAFIVYDDQNETITFVRVEYPANRVICLLKSDGNYVSSKHLLSEGARSKIVNKVGGYEKVEKAYHSLAKRIETADGAVQLAEYRRIYELVKDGLQVQK